MTTKTAATLDSERHPLHDLRLPGPTLVLVDDTDSLALDALRGIEDVTGLNAEVTGASSLSGPSRGWGSVLVVAADRARLRRLASGVPQLGQCRAVACWLTETPVPWVLVPRPEWPVMTHLTARTAGTGGPAAPPPAPPRRGGGGGPPPTTGPHRSRR